MTIDLILIGKTDSAHVASLVAEYQGRINRYLKFQITAVPDVKGGKISPAVQSEQEGRAILKLIEPGDYLALLDERGTEFSSTQFASWLQQRMSASTRRLVFVIGGPYGFSPEVKARANASLSLSKMTFSHQIVRALFAEQLYRAFTILRGEPYHHE